MQRRFEVWDAMATTQKASPKLPRDPALTRRKLLDAAYQEFTASGYHGASIQKICDRAGLSKQLCRTISAASRMCI